MGSIEFLPRAIPRRAAIDAWRSTPLPGAASVRVREARVDDYAAVRALERRLAPGVPACSLRQFESRLHGFAAGQLVAVCDGFVVGHAASLVVDWDTHGDAPTWSSLTGDGFFTTHDPAGRSLYGADLRIEATSPGFAAARVLAQARRKLARRMNLKRLVATPPLRLPAGESPLTLEQYARRIAWGDAQEPEWRFLMAQGFRFCGVLHAFHAPTPGDAGHAGLLSWLNPLHAPPGPPADERSEPPRKCA